MVEERPTVIRTPRLANAGGSEAREVGPEATQACQAPKVCTSGSVEKTPELR